MGGCTQKEKLLGEVFRETIIRWLIELTVVVLQPDDLHALRTLPPGISQVTLGVC